MKICKVKMCLQKYEDYEEIFFLPPDVRVAVLVCLRCLMCPGMQRFYFDTQNHCERVSAIHRVLSSEEVLQGPVHRVLASEVLCPGAYTQGVISEVLRGLYTGCWQVKCYGGPIHRVL